MLGISAVLLEASVTLAKTEKAGLQGPSQLETSVYGWWNEKTTFYFNINLFDFTFNRNGHIFQV